MNRTPFLCGALVVCAASALSLQATAGSEGSAAPGASKPQSEFPPFESVTEGLTRVVTTTDGSAPFYDLYEDREKGRLLAALPREYDKGLLMISCTISGGHPESGVMGPTYYAKWQKIGSQLALIEPNLDNRTQGGKEAQDSVNQLYTGRVITSLPILSMSPGGGPVIDLGMMGVVQSGKFFQGSEFGPYGPSFHALNPALARLTKAKSFPKNVIFEFEAPNESGRLIRLSYNFETLEGTPGYKPRKADNRVGYYYNWNFDQSRSASDEVIDRYITRWNIEKADPALSMSPPKQPIVWYIEHTTPVKYRRFVRDGILFWNKAFEKIGIVGALEVYQQDATTGAHMELDPEDSRYNFFRWNASDLGYAIGPSRTNIMTGEILDADVVWHQGLTRSIRNMLESLSGNLVEQTMHPETLAWFEAHPHWDPRVRLASTERAEQMIRERALRAEDIATEPLGGHEHPWTQGQRNPMNAACALGNMLSMDVTLIGSAIESGLLDHAASSDEGTIDDLPIEFIGPMIRYISSHEVGHCLGLQHNMAASSIRTLSEINSPGFEGPTIGSVMDYVAANINFDVGEVQGPYATPCVGPYDEWAIAFGYGPEDKLDEVLSRVSEPDLIYIAQAGISIGADPRNMTWDMGADNMQFCEQRMRLIQNLRSRLLDEIVDDGESWAVARRRYSQLLGTQIQALWVASRWVGAAYTNNDEKGDPGDRAPLEEVPAAKQRQALKFVIENGFEDAAFGLTPELVRHFGKEYWWDQTGIGEFLQDPSAPIHDQIGGVQATAMSLLLNPSTLRRVYDNEYLAQGGDALTLAEVMGAVSDNVWRECAEVGKGGRKSMSSAAVSSFRRNLQREHVGRLIDLALLSSTNSPSIRTISALATQDLSRIDSLAENALAANPDAYTTAHLRDVRARIGKALEAAYVVAR